MKKTLLLAGVAIFAMTIPAFAQTLGPVQTRYGAAQGMPAPGNPDVTLFKGIPYAVPPVGTLRWKAPQEPARWNGVRTFDTYAAAAMQYPNGMLSEPWKTDFYYSGAPKFSEDCLYLNVGTSAVTGKEKMPVLVWFHGGGLRHGFSYEVEFNNEVLAKKGVVVVTVGQRLGVFGYMALPQLSAETDYKGSGNYGFMDQVKALEWVRDNIAAFGGDPGNVTVAGQSGGTTKTGALFASEYSRGLQHKAIWESGLKWTTTFPTLAEAEQFGVAWLKHLGLSGNESPAELRAKDAAFFLGNDYDEYVAMGPTNMNRDNKYFTVPDFKSQFSGGGLRGIDVLCGTNLGEAPYTPAPTVEAFRENHRKLLGDLYDTYDFEKLVSRYCTLTDGTADSVARILATYGLATSDSRNLSLAMLFGQKMAADASAGNVYAYLFSHFAPGRNVAEDWAWHSSEMWYTFASLRDIPEQRAWTAYDHRLADMMSSYWANFMRTGNPNGADLPVWERSTAGRPVYMRFGEEVRMDTEITPMDRLLLDFTARRFGIDR